MKKTSTATVVKHTGSHYLLSQLPLWNPFPAVIRGRVRLSGSTSTNPVAVGDVVDFTLDEGSSQQMAVIDAIHPRTNCVVRKSANLSREQHVIAANLDRVFLVVTMEFPQVKREFVDRFLVSCEAYGLRASILINKTDIREDFILEEMLSFERIYRGAGYEVMEISALSGEGIADLRTLCSEGVSLFSGVSGVGKSSVIRALDPSLDIRTAEISLSHLQGRHTTTFYEMHPLSSGGFVIDTPGIRGFGMVDISAGELSTYFPEMLRVMDSCRFKPCTHTHEPHCAVKEAVESGAVSRERYASYLGMIQEDTKYR